MSFFCQSSVRRCFGGVAAHWLCLALPLTQSTALRLRTWCLCASVVCVFQVALEYLLKGPTTSGEQVKAEVKSKLSDEHIKVRGWAGACLFSFSFSFPGCSVGLLVFFYYSSHWRIPHFKM